ncbi:MAG: O-antigen ligase family protein [Desulfobulbaceae bacterium]|nr:O-antigen ligase family protein [Desulfobulbaceae bacterium]
MSGNSHIDKSFTGAYGVYSVLFKLSIISLFLTPALKLFGSLPALRLDDLLILLAVLYVICSVCLGCRVVLVWGWRQTLLTGFSMIILISILNGTVVGMGTHFGDLNKLIRLGKYLLFYTLTVSLIEISPNPEEEKTKILRLILVSSLLLVPLILQQYFNWFNLNDHYIKIVAPTQFHTLIDNYPRPRPVGMIGNPNELGFMYAMCSMISLYFVWKYLKFRYFVTLLVQIGTLLLTGSRSALVALCCGVCFFILVPYIGQGYKVNKKRLSYLLVAISCVFIFLIVIHDKNVWRFFELADIKSSASWLVRLDVWNETFILFWQNPFLGVGPLSRSGLSYSVDNEWLFLLRSYGLIGTIYFAFIFLVPHFKNSRVGCKILRRLMSSLLVCTSVYMIPAFVFSSLELMPILLTFLACDDSGTKRIVFN